MKNQILSTKHNCPNCLTPTNYKRVFCSPECFTTYESKLARFNEQGISHRETMFDLGNINVLV